jgi:HPr kinase/phosphorylase
VKPLSVEEFFNSKKVTLELELLTDGGMDREILSSTVSNPGLALAGFVTRMMTGRLQVLGETEIRYLQSLGPESRREALETFLRQEIPALIIAKNQEAPEPLLEVAQARGIPVLRSRLKTGDFYRRSQPFLEQHFAPTTNLHGSLADVYGVGLLFMGPSGIGKSECVLDLVERGHRLVADDLVFVTRRGNDVLIGQQHPLQRHHMEIRGIGIIDVRALFGIRAIRQQKRVEVVVQLEPWNADTQYERTGLDDDHMDVLGIQLPRVMIPLNAGKNITVISEVVAMNHLLKYSGVHSAREFDAHLRNALRTREYLEEDYE